MPRTARTAKKLVPVESSLSSDLAVRIEYVALDDVVPAFKNPKRHVSDEIQASIMRFGFVQPLTEDASSGRLLAGHGRLEALVALRRSGKGPPARIKVADDGRWLVPVLRGVSFANEKEARAFLIADNRLNELGGWDDEVLTDVFQGFGVGDLDGLGFSDEQFEEILHSIERKRAWLGKKPEMMSLGELKPHPRNYREHPDDQVEHLVQSIREHGLYRAIVATADGTILVGHGIVKAASKLGIAQVPVLKLNLDPKDPRALKLLAGDNESGHLAEVDDRRLSELLKEVLDSDIEGKLLGTGYDPSMLAGLVMVTRPATEIQGFNEAAEWVGMPEYQPGETSIQLVVTFKTEDDRKAFTDKVGLRVDKIVRRTWSARWPFTVHEDASSLRFVNEKV